MVLVELKLGEFEPQDKGQVDCICDGLEKNERWKVKKVRLHVY